MIAYKDYVISGESDTQGSEVERAIMGAGYGGGKGLVDNDEGSD